MKKLFGVLLALVAASASAQSRIIPGGGGSVASGSSVAGCTAYSLVFIDSAGNLKCDLTPINGSVTTAGRSIFTVRDSITGASATSNFLNVTGTFPATLSAEARGASFVFTGAGAAETIEQSGLSSVFTGSSNARQAAVYGELLGTNANSSGSPIYGVNSMLSSSTTVANWGVIGYSSYNAASKAMGGVLGLVYAGNGTTGNIVGGYFGSSAAVNPGLSAGVIAFGDDGATNGAGGYFSFTGLNYAPSSADPGVFTGKAALIADNAAVAANIFEARDNGTAVVTIADGGATTFTQPVTVSAGTSASPSIKDSVSGGGIWFFSGYPQLNSQASTWLFGGQTLPGSVYGLGIRGSGFVGFTGGDTGSGSAVDTALMREAAAVMQIGQDVNGAAVAQTLKAHDGITGTDIAGANFTLAGGRGTGIGASGNLILQTSPALATGTSAQVLEERFKIVGKQFALTDNTIATFVVQTLGDDTGGGGTIHYCVRSNNATTAADECGAADFNGNDITAGAGGEICTITKVATPAQALNGGATLAVTFAGTAGTDLCSFRVTADTSVATPTNLFIKYSILHSGRPMTAQ